MSGWPAPGVGAMTGVGTRPVQPSQGVAGRPGSADQRLLEAGGLAGGLAVDQGRIAVALERLDERAAREAGGQAVAEGDVACVKLAAPVFTCAKRPGRHEEGERQEARQ